MFGIVFFNPRTEENVGTALRSSFLFNANIFIIIGGEHKIVNQNSNIYKAHRHIPTLFFESWDKFKESFSKDRVKFVAIELTENSILLPSFIHPRNAMYIFGNETHGIPKNILKQCDYVVQIPTAQSLSSFNLSTACSIVLYDRFVKNGSS